MLTETPHLSRRVPQTFALFANEWAPAHAFNVWMDKKRMEKLHLNDVILSAARTSRK
jgi:hypothetical protein